MKGIDSSSLLRAHAQSAIDFMLELGAERALVLEVGSKSGSLEIIGAHGVASKSLEMASVSLGVIHQVLKQGKPLHAADATKDPRTADRWSLEVAKVKSVMCVPFWGKSECVKGVLYADTRARHGVFQSSHLSQLMAQVAMMEARFRGEDSPEFTPITNPKPKVGLPEKEPAKRSVVPATGKNGSKTQVAPKVVFSNRLPKKASYRIFFRSFSVLLKSGIQIQRALELSGAYGTDPGMAALSQDLSKKINQGQTISHAMASRPKAFSNFQLEMIRMGEKVGGLPLVLSSIADYEEKLENSRQRIKSVMTYPAIVMVLCLVMLLLGPPFLLKGQMEMIKSFGGEPPFITQVMLWFSDLMRSPFFLAWAAAAIATAVWVFRKFWERPGFRLAAHTFALEVPVLGKNLRLLAVSRFASGLSIMTRTGVPILQALPLAASTSNSPVLENHIGHSVDALKQGANITESLATTEFFGQTFMSMMAMGEESGAISHSADWVARNYELQLEASLEDFSTLLEPLILLVMGVMVGVMLLATLLPLIDAVQAL
jgi:type IV pilus assembly protein PilC